MTAERRAASQVFRRAVDCETQQPFRFSFQRPLDHMKNLAAVFLLTVLAPLHSAETVPGIPARFAGAARVDITPDYPVRLSGYGS